MVAPTHAKTALKNVRENFYVSDLESDMIEKHMFPLNITALPKYRCLLHTHIMEYLLNKGVLKLPTEEQRKGLCTVMFLGQ